MKQALLVLFFLGCLGMSALGQGPTETIETEEKETKSRIRKNVELYLGKVGLLGKVEILSEKKDRVFARDTSGELVKNLESDPNWVEEKNRRFFKFYGHKKGAMRTWRYARSPSLQITQIRNESGEEIFEIDIDKWRGFWKHFLREVVPHFVREHLKIFFVPGHTNQEKIAKQLAKWK